MASKDDYLALLKQKSEARQDPENVNRLSDMFDQYSQDSFWNPSSGQYMEGDLMGVSQAAPNDEQRMSKALGEAVIQDAASMNKIDELRALGTQGFISRYGLGRQAKQLVSDFNATIRGQSARASSSELDSDLFGQAQREALMGLFSGKIPARLIRPQ